MSAQPQFHMTPEKQGSVGRFLHNQLTIVPKPITNIELQGKTAIVTGANSGVGLASARQLLDLGLSRLILAVRSEEKGQAARADLEVAQGRSLDAAAAATTTTTIEIWLLDLADYSSITAFADRANASLDRLDLVLLSAGVFPGARRVNEHTKHEEMIQVNYLSNALLLLLLLPVCKAKTISQPTRITIVSSEVAAFATFKQKKQRPLLAALDKQDNFSLGEQMFVSKLLLQLFHAKLAKMVPPSVAVINAASPGGIHGAGFGAENETGFLGAIVKWIKRRIYNSCEVGSRTIVDAMVHHGEESHGQFFSFQSMVP